MATKKQSAARAKLAKKQAKTKTNSKIGRRAKIAATQAEKR